MPTVLCIDDQQDGLLIRKMFLETHGYSVLIAGSGPEGLQLLTRQRVDVLVLDYRMPGMDGAEVAREVRRRYPDVPIIILSGYDRDAAHGKTQDCADAWVLKGDSPEDLLRVIGKLAGGPHQRTLQSARAILDASRAVTARSRRQVESNATHLRKVRHPRRQSS